MTNQKQREQWADPIRDEATALQQQTAAGDTHAPVVGPLASEIRGR